MLNLRSLFVTLIGSWYKADSVLMLNFGYHPTIELFDLRAGL